MVLQGSETNRSSFFTIYKYIIIEFILSFSVAFLFFFFIFFVNQLLLLAEDILAKNVSLKNVSLIILYSLPAIISFSLPFSSLVGGLMSIGRMSSDREIMALQALGISFKRLFLPIIAMGIILSLFSFVVSDYFLPVSTIKFGKLYREILYSSPELELESYSIKQFQDSIIITGEVNSNGINNLIIIDKTEDKNNRIITSGYAELTGDLYGPGVTSLRLSDIISLTPVLKQRGDYNYFTSSKMVYNILLKNISFSIRNLTPREMSSVDIYKAIKVKEEKKDTFIFENNRAIDDLKSRLFSLYYSDSVNTEKLETLYRGIESKMLKEYSDRNLQIYKIEWHKKFSVSIACLIFLLFSFPISINSKKSSKSIGFGIGLFISIFYWSLLFAGQTLGIRMNFSPLLSMWFPNMVILSLGTVFMVMRFKR